MAVLAAGRGARTLVPPLEIPVGALASLVGGPCLVQMVAVSITKR